MSSRLVGSAFRVFSVFLLLALVTGSLPFARFERSQPLIAPVAALPAAQTVTRPRDPWVIRSVLDNRTRIVTVALHNNLWAAYDTNYSSLYLAWVGGVKYQGTVYDGVHGPQPVSQGTLFHRQTNAVWSVQSGTTTVASTVRYDGYTIQNNKVTLAYSLRINSTGQTIQIRETPEYVASGTASLRRDFTMSGIPTNHTVVLQLAPGLVSQTWTASGSAAISGSTMRQSVNGASVLTGTWNAAAAATTSSAPAAWDASAMAAAVQEAGVTLRTYQISQDMDRIYPLVGGQTPNVDKLMMGVNYSTTADFGATDQFISEVIANLNIATAGSYTFRLTSDDGSRLLINNGTVVNHDGLHGATSLEGSVTLAAGMHALKILYFDNCCDQVLRLEWRVPGSTTFTVVPASTTNGLSTDAGVVRVTSPGNKQIDRGDLSGGDGMPLAGIHPGYNLVSIRPSTFQPKVAGMDFLSDGRLVLSTWDAMGAVYILSGVQNATSPTGVTVQRFASGLTEPLGLKVVDDQIYVLQKQELTKLTDLNADGVADEYRNISQNWAVSPNFHEFAFGLAYSNGFFYANSAVAIDPGGNTTNPQPAANRGTALRISEADGSVTMIAGGLRTPNGVTFGPAGELFATDNQGGWVPSSKLLNIRHGRFYNHFTSPAGPYDAQPVSRPVAWFPQGEIGNSPSQPVYLTSGLYAGQMLVGDVTYGGLQRVYMERINNEYQGAVFRFTQGLEAGVNRIALGANGTIYVGGLGSSGNWGQTGKLGYGLQKLQPNGTTAFDILAMRARPDGFELEYTQPLPFAAGTNIAGRYTARQWRYDATSAYGGPKVDETAVTISSATVQADTKKVVLVMSGLKPGYVVYLRSPRPFTSASGASLLSTEAWYTLNAIPSAVQPTNTAAVPPSATPTGTRTYQAEDAALSAGAKVNSDHYGFTGTGFVDGYWLAGATTTFNVTATTAGSANVTLRYANGGTAAQTVSLYVNGVKLRQVSFPNLANWDTWSTSVQAVTLNAGANTIALKYDTGDTGNVNFDLITVASTGTPPTSTRTNTSGPSPTRTSTPVPSTNLALGKAATASATCNTTTETAPMAVDGSTTTKWCDNTSASKWLQVDLGASVNVNSFTVKHAGAGGENVAWNTSAFNIQTSTDNATWSPGVTVTGNTANETTHPITARMARYVRLNITTPTSNGDVAARIYELEVYGSTTATPTRTNTAGPSPTRTNTRTNTSGPSPTLTRTRTSTALPSGNLALNKAATSDSACNATTENAPKAVDGSTTTKWCSAGATKWLQVDLGTNYTVSNVVVKHAGAGGENAAWNTSAFNIQTSTDNATWSPGVTVTGNTASTTTHPITARAARYVRLNVTNGGADGVARIYELEVYAGAVMTPTPTRTPTLGGPRVYQAEDAALSGGAKTNNNHVGYTGAGFVDGYETVGASTTFSVGIPTAGSYNITLRYANGIGTAQTVSLYINGTKLRQISLPTLANWDTWSTKVDAVTLNAGTNTISYRYDSTDTGHINLDDLTITGGTVPPTATPVGQPAGAIVLFNGSSTTYQSEWRSDATNSTPGWTLVAGENAMQVAGGEGVMTTRTFTNFRLHVEFYLPTIVGCTGQACANSGVYLQNRYELQVLNSYGVATPGMQDLGAIYLVAAPTSNCARPSNTWQTYDITFTAAKWSGTTKTANATITVVCNGVTVQNNTVIPGPTGGGAAETSAGGPLKLQNHGDPVKYRNIWIEPLP